jgi:hypothetical protein
MERAPWGYGQEQNKRVQDALATMRLRSMWTEASILEQEITTLKAQVKMMQELADEAQRSR